MSKESLRVVLEIIETVMKRSDALSGATDTVCMHREENRRPFWTVGGGGGGRAGFERVKILTHLVWPLFLYAESVLGFLHEPTIDFVNEVCDTEEERHRAMKSICRISDVGTTTPDKDAARDPEEFEASIPENPQEWTQEMWEYMYEKEQEKVRNFEEQQLALEKKKRIQKRDWMKHIEEDGKLRRRQVKERERELKWLGLNMSTVFHVLN
ncbi:unnamed protein product [Prunus armeniaca]|uniref:Uncharacterized protein n=1 Tax=Prunus armeniaca TaxID=36596 RepID=A0A6J5Y8N8_PRUAR|nr:unnamed protein product [Prunus armeniaca]